MRYLLSFLTILSLSTNSCNTRAKAPTSSEEIISKSIEFHDPHQAWNKFRATFHFDSRFAIADYPIESLEVSINVPENYLRYHNRSRKIDLSYQGDSCFVHSMAGNCETYRWTQNFYTYIWGLPMKLQDPGVFPKKGFTRLHFNEIPCYAVQVHYEAENFEFYFDSLDFQLRGFRFIKNDGSGKGELITADGLLEFDGIRFPRKKTYCSLPDSAFGGTNEVLKILPF